MCISKTYKLLLYAIISALAFSTITKACQQYLTTDFCKYNCKLKKNMCCIYDMKKFGGSCGPNPKEMPLDNAEALTVLDVLNQIRNDVAAGNSSRSDLDGIAAANMHVLSYSKELAYSASCWAKQCNFGHSRCRAIKGGELGETVCFKKIPDAWVDLHREKMLLHCPQWQIKNFPKFTTEIIDYLLLPLGSDDDRNRETVQLMWAETKYIGCARVIYAHTKPKYSIILLVCQFFPKGNKVSYSIFERGKPCSMCSNNLTCNDKYPNLCGKIRPLENDVWLGPAKSYSTKTRRTYELLIILLSALLYFILQIN